MSTKKLFFGVMAGFTTGTILGIMLTSSRSVAMRKKLLAQSEAYLDTAASKFIDRLADFTKRFDSKLEGQVHPSKQVTALNKAST